MNFRTLVRSRYFLLVLSLMPLITLYWIMLRPGGTYLSTLMFINMHILTLALAFAICNCDWPVRRRHSKVDAATQAPGVEAVELVPREAPQSIETDSLLSTPPPPEEPVATAPAGDDTAVFVAVC